MSLLQSQDHLATPNTRNVWPPMLNGIVTTRLSSRARFEFFTPIDQLVHRGSRNTTILDACEFLCISHGRRAHVYTFSTCVQYVSTVAKRNGKSCSS
ncbi:hypothetical protein FOXYSP1_07637 [Fusarium oxysporum f. sp. phaseoli]